MTNLDDWAVERMLKAVDGCCGNAEWRGRFCQYHQGFEDGIDAVIDKLAEVVNALDSDSGDGETHLPSFDEQVAADG